MSTQNIWQSSNPADLVSGMTGQSSLNPYGVICGGATSTSPLQSLPSLGDAGTVLTSNGPTALPSFKSTGNVAGAIILLQTQNASNSASIAFTSLITGTYDNYLVTINNVYNSQASSTLGITFNMDWSTNNGSTYLSTNYTTGTYYGTLGGSTSPQNRNSTSTCVISPSNVVSFSNTDTKYAASLWLFDLPSATVTPSYQGNYAVFSNVSGTSNLRNGDCFGSQNTVTTINAIRFSFNTGNMVTGTFSLYGLVN